MSNMPIELPQSVVDAIVMFINNTSDLVYDDSSKNPIGKKIFNIIEKLCTVVYYPILDVDEKNDGFLLSGVPLSNGLKEDIIFINTYQTYEKQVFAAAHELGHYIKVADKLNNTIGHEYDDEFIVNRFAAEYLMPKDLFKSFFFNLIKNRNKNNPVISMTDMFSCIVETMDYFSVPYNAVAIRLVETDIIDMQDGKSLVDGNDDLSVADIKKIVDGIISRGEYKNLRTSSQKKEIKGLETILDKAEELGTESIVKINRLREAFSLVKNNSKVMSEKIHISEEEWQ